MERNFIVACFLLLAGLSGAYSQLYSAVFRLKATFIEEGKALEKTQKFFEKLSASAREEPGIKDLESFISETSKKHLAEAKQGDVYMEHPINIYHVVSRMATDWLKQLELISEAEDASVQEMFTYLHNLTTTAYVWPSAIDKSGVTIQLIRIQSLYFLDIHEFATGTLNGTHTDPLTLDEIRDVASYAYNKNLFYEAVLWYNGLVKEMENGGTGKVVTLSKAVRGLAAAYFRYENFKKPVEVLEAALTIDPSDTRIKADLDYYKRKLVDRQSDGDEVDKELKKVDSDGSLYRDALPRYRALCRGDIKKPESYRKRLKCRYSKSAVPYRPAKMEVLNIDPMIVMFHDVIYANEIQQVKRTVKPYMRRSSIDSGENTKAGQVNNDYRLSDTAWFDDDRRLMAKLSQRVEEKSGLSTKILDYATHAEKMQIVNYGIGGMYEPHFDYFNRADNVQGYAEHIRGSGDRIATWMFYINDVKVGGATVFPLVGARVPVEKGAAVFWPNFFINGTIDARTLHAGCPTVIGSKWIMNKWIRTNGQFDRWRCSKRRYRRTPAVFFR